MRRLLSLLYLWQRVRLNTWCRNTEVPIPLQYNEVVSSNRLKAIKGLKKVFHFIEVLLWGHNIAMIRSTVTSVNLSTLCSYIYFTLVLHCYDLLSILFKNSTILVRDRETYLDENIFFCLPMKATRGWWKFGMFCRKQGNAWSQLMTNVNINVNSVWCKCTLCK